MIKKLKNIFELGGGGRGGGSGQVTSPAHESDSRSKWTRGFPWHGPLAIWAETWQRGTGKVNSNALIKIHGRTRFCYRFAHCSKFVCCNWLGCFNRLGCTLYVVDTYSKSLFESIKSHVRTGFWSRFRLGSGLKAVPLLVANRNYLSHYQIILIFALIWLLQQKRQ